MNETIKLDSGAGRLFAESGRHQIHQERHAGAACEAMSVRRKI